MVNLRLKLFVGVLVTVFMTACSKDDHSNPYYWIWDYSGEIRADKNDNAWEGFIHGHLNAQPTNIGADLNIHRFDTFDDIGYLRDDIYLYRVPKIKGMYEIVKSDPRDSLQLPGAAFFKMEQDGDVVSAYYTISEIENSYIDILSIDGNEITAEFQITFVQEVHPVHLDTVTPDTIRFTNGYFHTTLNEY